jgi:hypothetical protein
VFESRLRRRDSMVDGYDGRLSTCKTEFESRSSHEGQPDGAAQPLAEQRLQERLGRKADQVCSPRRGQAGDPGRIADAALRRMSDGTTDRSEECPTLATLSPPLWVANPTWRLFDPCWCVEEGYFVIGR